MTVKPPGGPGETPPVPREIPEAKGPEPEKPFGEHLEGADAVSAASKATTDLAAEVVAQVREGTITVEEALEVLVERTLDDPAFARLSEERRKALRVELREVIASDPVLSSLVGQIGR